MKLLRDKKGQSVINGLQTTILGIASLAIILTVALYVLTSVGDEMPDNSVAQNATTSMTTSLAKAPTWVGILVIVIFAGAVMSFFYFRG